MADQNSQYYAILTNVGAAKQANADALGIPWKITQMGIGDAGGAEPTPNATQRALINEWRRAPLNQLKVDDKDASIIVAEQVIPADSGGRWIREIGLYDADGDLVAIANCPPTYKPLLTQGSGRTQVVRMNLVVSSASNVQLKIDPSVVLATREWVEGKLAEQDTKPSVLVATTANIALSGLQSIDGVALTAGVRVLVKNQNAGKDNGIYAVVAGGAWKRSADADLSAEVTPGLMVAVEKGTANGDSIWQLVTDAPITLGVTALAFEMLAGPSGVTGGTYKSVTVDKYGRVVAGSNPTTLAGHGIVDAVKIGQYGISTPLPLPASTDLNTMLLDGVYAYTSGEPLKNAPILGASHLIVRGAAAYPHQELKRIYQNRFFYRAANKTFPTESSADWESWVEMLHTGNMVEATQEEAETGVSASVWMSPRRVTQLLAKKVVQSTEAVLGWAKVATQTQVSNGADDATMVTPKKLRNAQASQVEAEAGEVDNKIMTPLRVFQAMRSAAAQATEVFYGALRLATQTEADSGTLDTVAVSPKKMRWGFAFSYTSNGYFVFPTWLGGLIIQWANGQINAGAGTVRVRLPLEFNSSLVVYSIGTSATGVVVTGQNASPTGIDINARSATNGAVPLSIVGYTFFCMGK